MKTATLDQGTKILALFKDTPAEQVQRLIESGLLTDLRDGNIEEVSRDAFRRLVGLKAISLIEGKGEINISPQTRFVVKEVFHSWFRGFDNNFREWFFDKIEPPIPSSRLGYGRLTSASSDRRIFTDLSDDATIETTLAQVHVLLSQQPTGARGVLSTRYPNIFYVRDNSDILRAVTVWWAWSWTGWHIFPRFVKEEVQPENSLVFWRYSD